MMEIKLGTRKMIPAQVGMKSLIGCGGEYPLGWANYFSFYDKNNRFEGIRCLNFWAENLQEAVRRFLPDGLVEVISYENDRFAIIDDSRIPENWYYNRLCFTGGYRPTLETAIEIYGYLGDEHYELEQFIDAKSYHAKRGWELSENGMMLTKRMG
jgi:hypothetical protein